MNPCITVCDTDTTISWYTEFLGFTCTFKSSIKNPEQAIIENATSKIFILQGEKAGSYASNTLVIEVEDLTMLYSKIKNEGRLIIWQPLDEGMFGSDQFIIKDYEDNKIIYKQKT